MRIAGRDGRNLFASLTLLKLLQPLLLIAFERAPLRLGGWTLRRVHRALLLLLHLQAQLGLALLALQDLTLNVALDPDASGAHAKRGKQQRDS